MKMFNMEFLEACKTATRQAYEGKVDPEALERLLAKMPVVSNDDELGLAAPAGLAVPSPIHADAGLDSYLIYSKVKCSPKHGPHNAWYFEEEAWGPGLGTGSSTGFMYTAYEAGFEALFQYTTAFHAQGIAATGGIFQINWFDCSGIPVGQYNGVLAGAGVFEIGGAGKWRKK